MKVTIMWSYKTTRKRPITCNIFYDLKKTNKQQQQQKKNQILSMDVLLNGLSI